MLLNNQQRSAIRHTQGPLLIIAGAGTGKTTVICERIKYLIGKKKLNPNQILALTFTEKAAAELLERLDMVMPLGYEEPWLSTFHSFCDRILRKEGLEIGLSPDYKILSQAEQWLLVKQHLFDFKLNYYRPLGNPTKFIEALLKVFSRLQDEDVNVKDFHLWAKSDVSGKGRFSSEQKNNQLDTKFQKLESDEELKRLKELSAAYSKYQDLKLKENVLDFGDLISWTLRLFRKRKNVLKKYQNQFKQILVDEFQDTNYAQLQLIKLLAPARKNPNLVVVGDDDQSIYKWRGAAISNILDFKKHYPKAKEIVLTKNYRSGQKLLDKTYKLIQNNNPDRLEEKLKIDKQLISQRKKSLPAPVGLRLASLETETDTVVEKILELVARKPYTYKDFAILARANNHLELFVATLKRHRIPYQLLNNRGLFDQDEVRTLLFFLKIVVDTADDQSLFKLLQIPKFAVKADLLLEMLQLAKSKRKTLWQTIKDSISLHEGVQQLVKQIELARQRAAKESVLPILYDFIQKTSYLKEFLEQDSIENRLKVKNINLFFNLLKRFESENKNSNLIDFVNYLDLIIMAGENPGQAEIEDIDAVRLLTVHSAKGLEFPVVFLVNAVVDRFPSRKRRELIELPEGLIKETLPQGDYHLQEERRLFYVAATRTRDYLFITAAKDYGGTREKKLSGFVKELGVEIKEQEAEKEKQLSWLEIPQATITGPRKVIDGRLKLDFISYSQIDIFKTCPLKYKYRYILQVPTRPHHALTFGQSIHNTLRDFHRFEQKGQKPDKKTLLFLYQQHFLPLGYDSKKHRKARFKAGKQALLNYFDIYRQQFSGKPYLLEQSFRLNIANTWLIGKIDRIDKLDGGGFELIDYKTGKTKDQKDVDKDVQLTIYKLAAQMALGIKVEDLSLYFIEENKKLTTKRIQKQLDEKKEDIAQTVREVKASKFEAKPHYPFPCGYCEYNQICPFAKKR